MYSKYDYFRAFKLQELMREPDIINRIFEYSREEAARTGWRSITIEHFMLGTIRHGDNEACRFLTANGIRLDVLKSMILDEIDHGYAVPYSDSSKILPSPELQHIIDEASGILRSPRARHIPDTLVYLSIILKEDNSIFADITVSLGLDFNHRFAESIPSDREYYDVPYNDDDGMDFEDARSMERETPEETLARFGTDLTKAAEEGNLDPVTGRDNEISRIIGTLCRRRKNNPIIVGDPGVGKTALADGVAMRIADRNVPVNLIGKRIVSLDMGAMVAGTKYRGDFEERLKRIMEAVRNDSSIILFIDEIHNIVGAGSSAGAMDAAAILKPALSRGEFQCIGTTTSDEYRKIIEKDGALARRFQKITVDQPSEEAALQILNELKPLYETFHGVAYTPEALKACISLSVRYIPDRLLPDKAIDVMDEAGAAAQAAGNMPDSKMRSMVSKLRELRAAKRELLTHNDFEEGSRMMKKEQKMQNDLDRITIQKKEQAARKTIQVCEEDIIRTVSVMTGIPSGRMSASSGSRITGLREALGRKVIGQEEAVDRIVRAITRNGAGLKDPSRPVGSFLFLGPTGVGKTHLAKVLAEQMFGSSEAIIRLDMSEYMEKFSVSRLIGAPPGYVGYDDAGQLSERVRQKPYSLVLFDEIEKAHPDIFNILLQVLDEGRLTDSNGRTVDFRNTIIILTSNIGSRDIRDFGRGIGFGSTGEVSLEHQKTLIDKALGKAFTPEFLNRLDETVYFRSLTPKDMGAILETELSVLYARVNEAGFHLIVSSAAKEFLCRKGYDPAYGARPLKRTIRRYLEDLIAGHIISGLKAGSTIRVDVAKDGTALTAENSGTRRRTRNTTEGKKKAQTREEPHTAM